MYTQIQKCMHTHIHTICTKQVNSNISAFIRIFFISLRNLSSCVLIGFSFLSPGGFFYFFVFSRFFLSLNVHDYVSLEYEYMSFKNTLKLSINQRHTSDSWHLPILKFQTPKNFCGSFIFMEKFSYQLNRSTKYLICYNL